ncbi:hypothetical protein [Aquipseudomonas campi]
MNKFAAIASLIAASAFHSAPHTDTPRAADKGAHPARNTRQDRK